MRATALGSAVAAALLVGVAAPAAQAAPSSGILPDDSRITLREATVKSTAVHGDTLYLAGSIYGVGLRSAGIAATDAGSGTLDRSVPELQSDDPSSTAQAQRVVADGRAGAYALGVFGGSQSGGRLARVAGGDSIASNWLRMDASGAADLDITKRFRTADGSVAWVYDVAVASDGTTYFSGDFTKVDGQARAGLAAIKADGTLTAWAPQVTGGAVGDLVVAGDDVLLVGGVTYSMTPHNVGAEPFTLVGGQARSGLALVDGTDGAVSAWAPTSGGEALTQDAASVGAAVDGDTVYLATRERIVAVGLGEAPVARDLDVRPTGSISGIAAGAAGRLYVAGYFAGIGSQEAQPSRSGLAEIVGATGAATAWAPDAPRSPAMTVTDDAVYVGGGNGACAAAFARTTAAKTGWDPRLGTEACRNVESLAASGSRVWAAGSFDAANLQERRGFAAIDTATDTVLPWAPKTTSEGDPSSVQDMEVTADGQTVYIAADMDTINGVARIDTAAVAATGAANTAGAVRAGFDPAPTAEAYDSDGRVQDLVLSADGQKVYAAGDFTSIGGQPRQYLASLSATTGQADGWNPNPDGAVNALELSPGGTLFAAGEFAHVGPAQVARFRLAAFTPGTNEPTAWDPQMAPGADTQGGGAVVDLALGDGVVYAAGNLDGQIGGKARKGVVALDATSGQATAWDAQLSGQGPVNVGTVSTTTSDGTVYLIGYSGGEFDSVQGKRRANLASVTAGGTVTGWHPGNWENGYTAPEYWQSFEVRELGDRVYVPVNQRPGFEGLPQGGVLSFGPATAPGALDPAVPARTTGSGLIDETLTCEPGSYSGTEPFDRSYEWLVDGKVAEGQTGLTYTVREADAGGLIACRETVENAAGPLVSTSEPVRAQAVLAVMGTAPEVSGVAKVGQTLRCSEGLWSTRVDSYVYAWLRDGQPIGGASGSSYGLTSADLGHRVGCRVVAVNGAGSSEPASSATVTVAAADVVTPPREEPPVQQPPVGQPPVGQPPVIQPPSGKPPVGKPPVTQPSASVSVAGKASAGKGRRFTLSVLPSAAGRVSVVARLKVGRKLVTVATGSGSAKRSGAFKLTLKPTSAGKRALRAGRSVTLSVRVTLKASNGATATATKSLKVKIKR